MRGRRQMGGHDSIPDDSEIDLVDLYADDDSEIDFDEGLPDRAARPRARARGSVDKSIPAGEGRYRDTIDFEEGLPSSAARVQIVKGSAAVELYDEDDELDIETAPVRIHRIGGAVETRVDTVKAARPPSKAEPPPAKPPTAVKATHHVHSATAGGEAVITSSDPANPGQPHSHAVTVGGSSIRTSTDPGGPGHTHTFTVGGAKVKTSGPAAPKKPTGAKAAKAEDVSKKIVMRGGEHCVVSEDGKQSFGCFKTRAEANRRLGEVEGFAARNKALPAVLSWEAVRRAAMPKPGTGSGLPESLEADVPPAFRFWKCEDPAEARAVRDALVESRLFTEETIREVDGVPRRAVLEVVEKLFLSPAYDDGEPVVVPVNVRPIEKAAALLAPTEAPVPTVLFDAAIVEVVGLDTILGRAHEMRGDYLLEAPDTPEVRKAIGGPCFRLLSRDDLVFATNAELAPDALVEWVQEDRIAEVLKSTFAEGRQIRLIKADEEEERIVFGVVLEPNEVDAQNDTISEEEIRQAAHKFMEDFGNLGLQHKEIVNGKLVLLETFIAPVPFEVNGEKVKKGSWLFKERVVDNALWAAVKKGDFTGFSIGGSAIRKPIE